MSREIVTSLSPADIGPSYSAREVPRATALRQLWTVAYRQRYPLLLSIAAALLLGAIAVISMPKKYTATSSVQLEQQTPQVISAPGLDPQPEDANRFLQTQLDRVLSRTLAQQVAAELDIKRSPEVLAALNVDTADGTDPAEGAIRALRENVLAELGLNTRLAKISFVSRDPQVSALIANAYAQALVGDNLRGKVETSDRAQEYLLDQLADAKGKLEVSERAKLAYARSANLTGTADADTDSMPAQQIGQLTGSLAAATAGRIEAQQIWQQARAGSALALPQVQENRAFQELLTQKAQLQSALAEDRQRHTDEYPSIAATLAQIAVLDREIGRLSGNIKQSFEQRYRAAASQEAQLKATIGQLRNAAMSEQDRSVGYNALERDLETNRVSYNGLLQRYKEVSAAAGAPAANVTLVDKAEPPLEPSSPKKLWIFAFAGLCGLIAGMAIALIRERLHDVIRTVDDLESPGHLAALGVVPALKAREKMKDALRNSGSAQSEAYKSIAASLQHFGAGKMPKTVLLTSTQANEGKSTSTWGLARGLRTLGYRVLVINGDLRNPSPEFGFAEALAGTLDPLSAAWVMDKTGLAVVDAGMARSDPVQLLAAARVRPVIEKLSAMADITLIDGPPVLGLVDAVLLADSVDAVIMVVEANRTEAGQLDVALSRLPTTVPIVGLLSKFDARQSGSSYGSYQYYSYGQAGRDFQPA